ncbi:hypothetical protein CIG19_01755 [Enterobacterales bacterium CwR94]|nr:hypothetical protein CIG19_01755 [Enterobacterales bacterium CwR94]
MILTDAVDESVITFVINALSTIINLLTLLFQMLKLSNCADKATTKPRLNREKMLFCMSKIRRVTRRLVATAQNVVFSQGPESLQWPDCGAE